MAKQIDVIFENGVFRPLEAVELPERQRGTVSLEETASDEDLLDTEFIASCAPEGPQDVTIEAVRQALAKIPGSLETDFRAERDQR